MFFSKIKNVLDNNRHLIKTVETDAGLKITDGMNDLAILTQNKAVTYAPHHEVFLHDIKTVVVSREQLTFVVEDDRTGYEINCPINNFGYKDDLSVNHNIIDLENNINNLTSMLDNVDSYAFACEGKIRTLEGYIIDLQHTLELKPLNASGVAQIAKELKDVLRLRRTYKDSLMYYKILLNYKKDGDFEKMNKAIKQNNKFLRERVYSKRVNDTIRESIRNEIQNM